MILMGTLYHPKKNPESAFLGPIDHQKEAKAAEAWAKLERKRERVAAEERSKEREIARLQEEENGWNQSQSYLENIFDDDDDDDNEDDDDDDDNDDNDSSPFKISSTFH